MGGEVRGDRAGPVWDLVGQEDFVLHSVWDGATGWLWVRRGGGGWRGKHTDT